MRIHNAILNSRSHKLEKYFKQHSGEKLALRSNRWRCRESSEWGDPSCLKSYDR